MLKRAFLFSLIILASCQTCKQEERNDSTTSNKIKVLSTIAMIADIVKEVGADEVECDLLIQGELDPHTYELVKGDDEKFHRADLIFYNGLGLEHGYSLSKQLENNNKAIGVGNWILEKEPSLILTTNGQSDPHIWMDVSLWKRVLEPIVTALSEKDPAHATLFAKRGEELKAKMEKLDQEVYTMMQSIPEAKRYLVTSHNAFHYFTRRYLATQKEIETGEWKLRSGAPEGIAPESELSAHDLESVIAYIAKMDVSVMFAESNINRDALNKIMSVSKERGKALRFSEETLYADAMGEEASYLQMIAHNAAVIAKELRE